MNKWHGDEDEDMRKISGFDERYALVQFDIEIAETLTSIGEEPDAYPYLLVLVLASEGELIEVWGLNSPDTEAYASLLWRTL